MRLRKEKGFTLIELMIVVAIIGILAAVAIPKFADLIDRAKEAKTKGNLSAIRSAVGIYYGSQEGEAPNALLGGLVTEYMSKLPGGDVPSATLSGTKSSYSWADGTDGKTDDFSGAGLTNLSTNGYAYDSSEPEVWVELSSETTDTKGNAIYLW